MFGVFQAGGQEVSHGQTLAARLKHAAEASVIRLYSQFDPAVDHSQWSKVLDEARKGSLEALKAVDHTQPADQHPVCRKLLAFIGPGKKGSEIRQQFEAPPFGWPRDAIDGALYALLAAGHLKARDAGAKPVDAKNLDRNKLTQASFQPESITLIPPQLIKIRQLFNTLGVPCQPKEESAKVLALLTKLREQAASAGGAAPAPPAPSRRCWMIWRNCPATRSCWISTIATMNSLGCRRTGPEPLKRWPSAYRPGPSSTSCCATRPTSAQAPHSRPRRRRSSASAACWPIPIRCSRCSTRR
ncbi:MAG: hypothetical protein MZV65_30115 [Chromatiales bacterium]|nr:hypothetical protein [Chromatiales bacterium]